MISSGQQQFQSQYSDSPITLSGGIATNASGGVLAVSSLLPAKFAQFKPVSGSSLLKNSCATYPMANQAVAGNAVIAMPVNFSMYMVCPANGDVVGYLGKSAVMQSLVASLKQHIAQGGLFTAYTPAFTWANGILLDLRDVTGSDTKQTQVTFSWDFYFPLITLAAAQAAQCALYQALTSGAPISGQPSFSSGATNPTAMQQPAASLTPPTIQ